MPDALKQCDGDAECGGYEVTTNENWHGSFDRDGLSAVQLFKTGSQVLANYEWSSFLKDCEI